MPKQVKEIICDSCGYTNAEIRIVLPDGMITINKKGKITWSDDPTVNKGDPLKSFINRIQIEDYLGECPECEDEAFIGVHFTDGTKTDDPEQAIQDMI